MLKQLGTLKDALDQSKQRSDALYESFALGEISRDEYVAQKANLREVADVLSGRITSLTADIESSNADDGLQNRFVDTFKQYTEVQALTDEIVDDVLTQIRVYPDLRVEIDWNYQDDLQKLISCGYFRKATG